MNDSADKLVANILLLLETENVKIRQERLEQYADFDEEEKEEESFEEFCDRFLLKIAPAASMAEIEELEFIVGHKLPDELREFYLRIGGIVGQPESGAFNFSLFSVTSLLENLKNDLSTQNRLLGLGIIQMVRFAWGDGHLILKPENGEISEAEVSRLNKNYTSFGFLLDSSCESHGYFYFDKDENFGYASYHQDDFPPSDPRFKATHSFFSLLNSVLEMIIHDEDDLFESIEIEEKIYF